MKNTPKKTKTDVHRTPLHKTYHAIKNKPRTVLYIILLDIGFFALFYLINYLTNKFFTSDPTFMTQVQTNTLFLIGSVLLFVVYVLVIALAYSFFSLVILGHIRSYSKDHTHDFSLLKDMFIVNLVLFTLFFVLFVLFNIILSLLVNKSVWVGAVVTFLLIIVGFLFYAFWSFTHSLFILGHELEDVFKHSAKSLLTRSYLGLFVASIGVIFGYFILYFIVGLVFKDYIIKNYTSFVDTASIVTLIFIYLVLVFNRVYFFFIAEHHVGHATPKKLKKK